MKYNKDTAALFAALWLVHQAKSEPFQQSPFGTPVQSADFIASAAQSASVSVVNPANPVDRETSGQDPLDETGTAPGTLKADVPGWPSSSKRPAGEGRPLVIRFTETDPKTLAATEEDLNIMTRILEKATRLTGENQPAEAMGVKLLTSLGGGARSMQIEGQGAIFFQNVGFPLIGSEAKTETGSPKEPTNSTWEQTKRELQGRADYYGLPGTVRVDPRLQREGGYDAKRVEKLKDLLLDTLKHASNMGHLRPEESVTLVVASGGRPSGNLLLVPQSSVGDSVAYVQRSGNYVYSTTQPDGSVTARIERRGTGGGGSGTPANPPTAGPEVNQRRAVAYKSIQNLRVAGDASGGSTMTIRVKKSDIDSFAKGKLSLDEFRNKAAILIY